jgi:hypothetical protein
MGPDRLRVLVAVRVSGELAEGFARCTSESGQ